jgi:hypothetical protein
MKINRDDIENILINEYNWIGEEVLLKEWHNGKQISIKELVYKHPTKKIYYCNGTFGKAFRVYKGRQIDITHKYYECSYNGEYDHNGPMGALTLDDFIAINLK